MFEMFDSNDRDIQLGITVKLPDQDFLGMLYSNAKDKDKFMDELTDFVFRVINKKVVKSESKLKRHRKRNFCLKNDGLKLVDRELAAIFVSGKYNSFFIY